MLGGGMMSDIASVKSSAAWMSASARVMVGMVKYLCLKNTVLHTLECFVLVI